MNTTNEQFKKEYYPINSTLRTYLEKYKRTTKTNVFYDDLLRFQGGIDVFDKTEKTRCG